MPAHPNANAAALSAGAALLLVWLLKTRFNIDLSIYYAGLIVGASSAAVLFVGRRGLKGAALALWRGTGSVWTGKPPPK